MVFPLPDELIGLTFSRLDAPSLLRCMAVCKLFQSIVLENAQLCYEIELFASCMEDNKESSMDTTRRLNMLREYNQAWSDMEWSSYGTIDKMGGHCWEFTGGVIAQVTPGDEISFVRLPCKLKGIEEKRWVAPFDFGVRDFTMDISQDLVALIELRSIYSGISCKLHLRTLLGDSHSETTVAYIAHEVEGLDPRVSPLIQICSDYVALLYHDQDHVTNPTSFFVYNWKTGEQKVFIHASIQSFAFMTEDLILATVVETQSTPILQVLRIDAFTGPVYSMTDVPFVCELHYPKLAGTTEHILVRSDPTPSWKPPADLDVPFYASPKHLIFSVSMCVNVNSKRQNTMLFIPLSTLLSQVEQSHLKPRRCVEWEDWGPSGTRILNREPSSTWVCYVYGTRFIQGLQWKKGHEARLYDFNPHAAKRHFKTTPDSPIPWKRLAKGSVPGSRCDGFEGKVSTRLPGRVAGLTLAQSEEGWGSVMIGEDHIVMVRPGSPGVYGYMAL